jgi:AraC-like DNA-binding protein
MTHSQTTVRKGDTVVTSDGWIDEIHAYLTVRGVAADSEEFKRLLRRLFEVASIRPEGQVTVAAACKYLYTSRRTLGRWCAAAGLPNPNRMLQVARILTAVHFLSNLKCSIKYAAGLAGWSDPYSMSNAMVRLVGARPSAAIARTPVRVAELWLQKELAVGSLELRKAGPPECPSCGRELQL